MEDCPAKISKIVSQKKYISSMKCKEIIEKSMLFGLEKKRRNLDKKVNRKNKVKLSCSEIENNKTKWEQFLVCNFNYFSK